MTPRGLGSGLRRERGGRVTNGAPRARVEFSRALFPSMRRRPGVV